MTATRRTVLCSAGAAVLAGCAGYGPGSRPAPPVVPAAGGAPLAALADVPVGGGVVLADQDLVLTQPEAGTVRAFSATCTHQGCIVADVAESTINCTCHGSRFSVLDGSVVAGPAPGPLPEQPITITDGQVALA